MSRQNNVRQNYFWSAFTHQNEIIGAFAQVLEQKMFGDFDGIVCRGVSGLLVSSILANRFNLKMLVARKPNESSHDNSDIAVGDYTIDKFIIVDDFVETGNTILECLRCVNNTKESYSYNKIHYDVPLEQRAKMEYLGCFLYCGYGCTKSKMSLTNPVNVAKCCDGKKFVCWNYYNNELVKYQY